MISPKQFQMVLQFQGVKAANEFAIANGDVFATGIEDGVERYLTPAEAREYVTVWDPATYVPVQLPSLSAAAEEWYNDGPDIPDPDTYRLRDQDIVPTPTPQPTGGPLNIIDAGPDGPTTIGGSIGALPVAITTLRGVALLLRGFLGNATRVTANAWARLTPAQQTIAATGGILVGTELALDLTGIDDTGIIPGFGFPDGSPAQLPNAVIVGNWTANGVKFYRLSDGKIAVQRKNGTWKVWRPKKPIVLYSNGAGNLKTFLRADSALDKQAKRLKKALNRRAPTRKRSTQHDHGEGTTITQVKA